MQLYTTSRNKHSKHNKKHTEQTATNIEHVNNWKVGSFIYKKILPTNWTTALVRSTMIIVCLMTAN